jgi:hypothetical protein
MSHLRATIHSIPYRKFLNFSGIFCIVSLIGLIIFRELFLFKSMPINGAFQLYNPLLRLASGEIIGNDFDFFHGSGTILSHYPLFALFGGDLHASEISRKIMSPLVFFLCFHICAAAWRIPFFIASFSSCVILVIGDTFLFGSTAMDGASVLGLRSFIPAIVLPIAILLSRFSSFFNRPIIFHLVVGILLGLAIFTSTEQGLAALGVHGLLILIFPFKFKNVAARFLTGAATGVIALAVFISCSFLTSGFHAFESLKFLLADLPKEQFWYFGAPPNNIPEFPNLFWNSLIVIGVWLPLILILLEILWNRSGARRGRDFPMESLLVLALLGMAMVVQIPQLASYSHYQSVATRNMGLVLMLWTFRIITSSAVSEHSIFQKLISRKTMFPLLVVGTTSLLAIITFVAFRLSGKSKNEASDVTYAGMTVSKGWASDLAVWDELASKDTKVAGTYRALVEDRQGSDFGGPDYIIHALGSRRERFLENVVRYDPDFFLTLKPTFTKYEEWLQLRHWDVYQLLLDRYTPVKASDFHVFWKKQPDSVAPGGEPVVLATTAEGGFRVSPPNTGAPCVYTVKVRYAVTNPAGVIPVFGKLPRYLLSRDRVGSSTLDRGIPASLPPGEESWEFPIILGTGQQARFGLEIAMALPGCKAEIRSIELVETSRDPLAIEALTDGDNLPGPVSH